VEIVSSFAVGLFTGALIEYAIHRSFQGRIRVAEEICWTCKHRLVRRTVLGDVVFCPNCTRLRQTRS
jgi:hypothetical protein